VIVPKARDRRPAAPRWWQELFLIAVLYGGYTLTRDALPTHKTAAFHRASSVLSIERWLHIDVERWANRLVAGTHWLAYGCDYYYSTLHFAVTLGVLIWLYRRHPSRYRSIRSVLVITTLVALVGFTLLPLAPPRMLPGYVDTVVRFHTWGSLASPSVAKASNEFAAMPSLHIGWSLWCAWCRAARRTSGCRWRCRSVSRSRSPVCSLPEHRADQARIRASARWHAAGSGRPEAAAVTPGRTPSGSRCPRSRRGTATTASGRRNGRPRERR
jgi:hypothetical protein